MIGRHRGKCKLRGKTLERTRLLCLASLASSPNSTACYDNSATTLCHRLTCDTLGSFFKSLFSPRDTLKSVLPLCDLRQIGFVFSNRLLARAVLWNPLALSVICQSFITPTVRAKGVISPPYYAPNIIASIPPSCQMLLSLSAPDAQASRAIPARTISPCVPLMEYKDRSRRDNRAASLKMQTGETVS